MLLVVLVRWIRLTDLGSHGLPKDQAAQRVYGEPVVSTDLVQHDMAQELF